jgi:hypothetical protein
MGPSSGRSGASGAYDAPGSGASGVREGTHRLGGGLEALLTGAPATSP